MNIGKLSRLFSSLAKPANNQDTAKLAQANEQAVKPAAVDAVAVNFSKHATAQPASDASDPEKVARIKKQVADGTYRVDSNKVAAALMNELGIS